jgi:hypothetical protein
VTHGERFSQLLVTKSEALSSSGGDAAPLRTGSSSRNLHLRRCLRSATLRRPAFLDTWASRLGGGSGSGSRKNPWSRRVGGEEGCSGAAALFQALVTGRTRHGLLDTAGSRLLAWRFTGTGGLGCSDRSAAKCEKQVRGDQGSPSASADALGSIPNWPTGRVIGHRRKM